MDQLNKLNTQMQGVVDGFRGSDNPKLLQVWKQGVKLSNASAFDSNSEWLKIMGEAGKSNDLTLMEDYNKGSYAEVIGTLRDNGYPEEKIKRLMESYGFDETMAAGLLAE